MAEHMPLAVSWVACHSGLMAYSNQRLAARRRYVPHDLAHPSHDSNYSLALLRLLFHVTEGLLMQDMRDPHCLIQSLECALSEGSKGTELYSAVVRRFNKGLQWTVNGDYAEEKGLITPLQRAVLRQVLLPDQPAAERRGRGLSMATKFCPAYCDVYPAVHVSSQDSLSVLRSANLREAHWHNHLLA